MIEIIYQYNYPQYGTGIGYYSSCLPLEANKDVVTVMYKYEQKAKAECACSDWQSAYENSPSPTPKFKAIVTAIETLNNM